MPRNHLPGASTLRNRNRITNKTRLKIHHGNIDADSLLIPDEDEEKHRLTNLVAGVDAEDANEHHLQAVLSASSQRNNVNTNRLTRGSNDKTSAPAPPQAFIPTPDSTGVVDNYAELYPPNRWKDPATYICTSTTVEEATTNALAHGFTYYMDERDSDWLEKNNEEARGEGTSAQGAVSASGTRSSARSAKAKGKEPDTVQPVVISEDAFELVMGLFEKVTHEKTEYLHHSLKTDNTFPAFTDYQDVFSSELPPTTFANFTVPTWIPPPPTLTRFARVIYPYWKERRIEREGHRIIPALNGDETDTLNESYICFRRREIKAVRKTRASQVTSSDKLSRLQTEFAYPLELAKAVLTRETTKNDLVDQSQAVWEKRLAFVNLKRSFPTLGDKADEELLIDKERPVKKPEASRLPLRIRPNESGLLTARPETVIRPKERFAMIQDQIDATLAKRKDADHHWEDQIDNVYQPPLASLGSRLFKYIPQNDNSEISHRQDESFTAGPRPIRMRFGRGGRILIDRRNIQSRSVTSETQKRAADAMDVDDDEVVERRKRLEERWKFDADDGPAFGPDGPEEQDRILVDDYDTGYLRHTMSLLSDMDQQALITDSSLLVTGSDGRQQMVTPFKLGVQNPVVRRDHNAPPRQFPPMISQSAQQPGVPLSAPTNGVPIASQQAVKKMAPPAAVPQMRISANGGMRPPNLATPPGANAGSPPQMSPPTPGPQQSPLGTLSNGVNGINRPAINLPHVDSTKSDLGMNISLPNGVAHMQNQQTDPNHTSPQESAFAGIAQTSPTRPKSQNQLSIGPNGYHLNSINGYAAAVIANASPYGQHSNSPHSGLSAQQVQNLKSAFNTPGNQDLSNVQVNGARPGPFLQAPNGSNFNLQLNAGGNMNMKLPAGRQMQWPMGSPMQRPTSALSGLENGVNGVGAMTQSPNGAHMTPVRTPSANGTRPTMRGVMGANGQMSMSPHLQNSPSPLPSIAQSQSPPRLPLTPTLGMASPSLQHQQPVGNSQSGY